MENVWRVVVVVVEKQETVSLVFLSHSFGIYNLSSIDTVTSQFLS